MKLAVVTRADDNIKSYTDLTHPIIEKFCKTWNADFIKLDHNPGIMTDDNHPHLRIMKSLDLLDTYDRILHLDSDVVINVNCPNIFELVHDNLVGTIFEDKGSRTAARRTVIRKIQNTFGDIGWLNGYINTGVFIVSKMHKELFTPIDGKYWTGWGSDDVHIGYKIRKLNFKIYELPFQFNHMTMFSEPWNNNANRFDSYIIHYAGAGIFDQSCKTRLQQIKNDIKQIYGV